LGLREGDGDGLRAGHLADHGRDLAGVAARLDEVARLHAVLGGCLHEVGGELVLADLHVLGLGDRVEQQLALEHLLALLGDLGAVHVVCETVLVLEVAVHLVVDEALRNRDVGLLDEQLHELVARGRRLTELGRALELLLDVLAQLADGVELARDLGEVVVGLGKLAFLDRDERHRDLSLLALVVAAHEFRLEGRRLARGEGVEGLVDALDELARADLVGDVGCGVDLLATDRRDEVELGEVARLCRSVDGHERAEAAAQVLELGLDLIRPDLRGLDLDLEAVVLRHLELGAHVDLDREDEVAGEVLLAGPGRDVRLGATERAQLLGVRGVMVETLEPLRDGVVEHLGAADALVDDGRRHLALAETGDRDLLGDVLVGVLDRGLQLVGGDGDRELGARGRQLLDGRTDHGDVSPGLFADVPSGRQDLNLRPPAPKAGTLAKLSYAPDAGPSAACVGRRRTMIRPEIGLAQSSRMRLHARRPTETALPTRSGCGFGSILPSRRAPRRGVSKSRLRVLESMSVAGRTIAAWPTSTSPRSARSSRAAWTAAGSARSSRRSSGRWRGRRRTCASLPASTPRRPNSSTPCA